MYAIDGDYAVKIASEGAQCSKCERVHLSTGNIGAVARSGQIHFTTDVHSDPTYTSCFADVRGKTVVPVLPDGRVIGVIDAESSNGGPIDPSVLATLADQIAPFVQTPDALPRDARAMSTRNATGLASIRASVGRRSVATTGCAGQMRPKRTTAPPLPYRPNPDLPLAEGSNAAKTFAGSDPLPATTFAGSAPRPRFSAAVYRAAIAEKLDAGLSLKRIWQDLVEEYGYGASY